MRFRVVHKLTSYLLVLAALVTLATTGAVPVPTLALLALMGALSWFVEPGTRMGALLERAGLVFNVVALAFFALSLFAVVRSFPEPDLTPILNLVLFLLGYKLFLRRTNRDYMQLYVLSFMLIVAAAWLAQGVLFIVGFAAYLVLATWTLILFHLRREIEDNYLVKHGTGSDPEKVTAARVLNSRRVVGPAFFTGTALVALAVFVGAAAVFATIPRIGLGFLTGGVRRRMNIVGFSDEVTLGHHGVISMDNDAVVLRARIPRLDALTSEEAREREVAMLYWRATVYDRYADGGWTRSASATSAVTLVSLSDRFSEVRNSPDSPPRPEGQRNLKKLELRETLIANSDAQEIQVVALEHPIAFALDQPVAFEAAPRSVGSLVRTKLVERGAEVRLQTMRLSRHSLDGEEPVGGFSGARYTAYSRDPIRQPRIGAGLPIDNLPEGFAAPYLAVPRSLSPRVAALAQSITRDKQTPAAKVMAVMEWLKKNYRYTTELKRDPSVPDPLEDFLFVQNAGHCEYFASAAAILLRLSGVPTRYINGFLGGEWNGLNGLVTVRENRAHSWAEAYLGTFGWVRIDATPAAEGRSRMGRVRQLFDAVEYYWSRWVIEYDVGRQFDLARRVGRRLGVERGQGFGLGWKVDAKTGAVVAGVVAGALLLWRARRRLFTGGGAQASKRRGGGPPIFALYARALDRLAAIGWVRRPSETPREFADRLVRERATHAETVALLTTHYTAARYGMRDVPDDVVESLRTAVESINRRNEDRRGPHRRAA